MIMRTKLNWIDDPNRKAEDQREEQLRHEYFRDWWTDSGFNSETLELSQQVQDMCEAAWNGGYRNGREDAETDSHALPKPDLERYLEGFDAGMKMCLKLSRTFKEEEDSGRWEGSS